MINSEINKTEFRIAKYLKELTKGFDHNQPERLSEKTYYRNEDGTYPHLEAVIRSDSPNS